MIFYLPGCDVRKNHPEAVGKMTAYMEDQGLRQAVCCRKDLGYIGEDDEIIQNCTLCDLVLRERLPENTVRSLYEFLLDTGFDFPDYYGRVITVQDCWRTRNNRPLQDAVRECLRRMHFTVRELAENYENTRFCGVWLNNPAAPDLPAVTPELTAYLDQYRTILTPAEQQERMKEWVSQYDTDYTAVYCNGCERGIRLGGGHPVHMIELLTRDL